MEKTEPKPDTAQVVAFDRMPIPLRQMREVIRDMMRKRCAAPGSPIPPACAVKVADWIMMLCAVRAAERVHQGHKLYGDTPAERQAALHEDVSRSAEMIEICFMTAIQEAGEAVSAGILLPDGPPPRAA